MDAGADAIGLVFYEPSPRNVTLSQAAAIARVVGPFVTVVGLFVDAPASTIERTLDQVPLHVIQFHGGESQAECQRYGRPFIKALRMKQDFDVEQSLAQYNSSNGIILDAYRKGVPGGTGETFDWGRVPHTADVPLILAGGLNPDNVAEAVRQTGVYGVDVSGGVESSPGVKDATAMRLFVQRAKQAAFDAA